MSFNHIDFASYLKENADEIKTKTDIVATFTYRYLISKNFTLTNVKKEVIVKTIFMDKQLDGGFISYYMKNNIEIKVVVVTSIDFIRTELMTNVLPEPIIIRTNVVDVGDTINFSEQHFTGLNTKLENKIKLMGGI